MERKNAFIDWINLLLAIALFISPWVFGFAAGVTTTNAMVGGVIIGVVAIIALVSFAQWEEWVNLVAGLGVAVSPWVIGFAGETTAVWVHVAIGLAVAVLAAIELFTLMRQPPSRMMPR
jgi:hypothetical protein